MAKVNRVTKHVDSHVCVCRFCGGTGYANGLCCPQCEGSGRVIVSSDIVTMIEPFSAKIVLSGKDFILAKGVSDKSV